MKELSNECWELINKYANEKTVQNFGEFRGACKLALTNPDILKAANLYATQEKEAIDLVAANSIYFKLDNEVKPIMKISNGKFYWKDEEIDDIHNVYERFNEWLTKTNLNK